MPDLCPRGGDPYLASLWQWQEKEILITVKTYADPGKTNRDADCIAGVSDGRWIRLYPLQYRHLPYRIMFRKYDIIRVKAARQPFDPRPESFRPDSDSIEHLAYLDTGNRWEKRRDYLLPAASGSMCEIRSLQKSTQKSLGMFKPREVKDLIITREIAEGTGDQRPAQMSLERKTNPVERIPYSFTYYYKCEDAGCKGHKMKTIDWEIARFYRRLQKQNNGSSRRIEEKIRSRFLEQMFGPERDSYFFVGNTGSHPQRFSILGIFSPPTL